MVSPLLRRPEIRHQSIPPVDRCGALRRWTAAMSANLCSPPPMGSCPWCRLRDFRSTRENSSAEHTCRPAPGRSGPVHLQRLRRLQSLHPQRHSPNVLPAGHQRRLHKHRQPIASLPWLVLPRRRLNMCSSTTLRSTPEPTMGWSRAPRPAQAHPGGVYR